MFTRKRLGSFYLDKGLSVSTIARLTGCSQNKVNYWIAKHGIVKRSISEAIYRKRNPKGDPFEFKKPMTLREAYIFGLGYGLYWGEGTKKSGSVRLGNSDPKLIKTFIYFLKSTYNIDTSRLRFGLQIFGDMNSRLALEFWSRELQFPAKQFYKPIVTPHRGVGNYRQKTKYGVLTVYFNNKKLRDILCETIESMPMVMPT